MRPAILLAAALLTTVLVPAPAAAEEAPHMRIGMDIGAIDGLRARGAPPELAMFWLGAWNGDDPTWAATNWLNKAKANGVTPVIQWWYWGDDISPSCVQYGCDGRSQAEWRTAGQRIADSIRNTMEGREVIVVIEPEFNKDGIESWETWDGLWVDHARMFHEVAGVKVVLSFGNWGLDKWANFDRSIAEADLLGFQTMRGSTQSSLASFESTDQAIADAARKMKDDWGKPSLLTDLALSSYPEPDYLKVQERVLSKILGRADEYEALGLTGIVYRSLKDSPGMSLDNHFREAERHWGLAWSDGRDKPAFAVWKAYAEGRTVAPPSPPPPTTPTFASAIEGEAMEHTTGGRANDAAASGGAAWNLWSNGDAKAIAEATGSYDLVVRARGEAAAGAFPSMDVVVDGVRKATFTVPSGYADYTVPVELSGKHAVAVRFTNDFRDASGDRNLIVDKVELRSPPPPPEPGRAEMAGALAASDAVAGRPFTVAYQVKNAGGADVAETFGVAVDGAFASGGAKTIAPGATATVSVSLTLPAGPHALEARMGAGGATVVPGDGSSATVHVKRAAEARLASALAAPASVEAGRSFTASYAVTNVGEVALTQAFSVDANGASHGTTTLTLAPGETRTVAATLALQADATLTAASNGAPVPGDGSSAAVKVARPAFAATFTPRPGNQWWIETGVSANAPLSAVTVSVDGGAPKTLTLRSWGTWAASFAIREGAKVVFTATSNAGEAVSSAAYRWPDASPWVDAPAKLSWKKEAESAVTKSTGGRHADSGASAGAAWNLWSNGYLQDSVKTTTSGTYTVGVTAKGSAANGVYAAFDLVVDGKVVGSFTTTSAYKTFTKSLTLGAGTHTVKVVFKNDLRTSTGDRNLLVDVLTVEQM